MIKLITIDWTDFAALMLPTGYRDLSMQAALVREGWKPKADDPEDTAAQVSLRRILLFFAGEWHGTPPKEDVLKLGRLVMLYIIRNC